MKQARQRADERERGVARELERLADRLPFPCHGARRLHSVTVVSYNVELRSRRGGFVGDRATKGAFLERIDAARAAAKERAGDPFGDVPTVELSKKALSKALSDGSLETAAVVQSAIEEHAQALADVIRHFRRKAWRGVDAIVIGGGMRGGRVGELAIARAQSLLDEAGTPVALRLIGNHPDEAGLIGAAHLVPPWMLGAYEAMLAADIGGTNLRCGIVRFRSDGKRVRKIAVEDLRAWQHREDAASRTAIAEELAGLLKRLAGRARKARLKLAPLIAIGCPGHIEFDGRIARGTQILPGDWERPTFHLPTRVRDGVGEIGGVMPAVVMHNDAVVQGLSELEHMAKHGQWGVLTIGTGLGNAAFRMHGG